MRFHLKQANRPTNRLPNINLGNSEEKLPMEIIFFHNLRIIAYPIAHYPAKLSRELSDMHLLDNHFLNKKHSLASPLWI